MLGDDLNVMLLKYDGNSFFFLRIICMIECVIMII